MYEVDGGSREPLEVPLDGVLGAEVEEAAPVSIGVHDANAGEDARIEGEHSFLVGAVLARDQLAHEDEQKPRVWTRDEEHVALCHKLRLRVDFGDDGLDVVSKD